MKALTICQPYAELICTGEKRVENRTWPTRYRGPLAIHAGKSRDWLTIDRTTEHRGDVDTNGFYVNDLDFGAIVARAVLIECLRVERIQSGEYDEQYPWLRGHEHVSGPWCWVLDAVARLRAIPYRGAQGLFSVPDQLLQEAA